MSGEGNISTLLWMRGDLQLGSKDSALVLVGEELCRPITQLQPGRDEIA